jgi:subtilisin-like proprotein convertase family protein
MLNRSRHLLVRVVLIASLLLSWLGSWAGLAVIPAARADEITVVPLPETAQPPQDPKVIVAPTLPQGQAFVTEIESNNTYTTAMALPNTNLVLLGKVYPNADVDYYAFTTNAGDRVYAAVQTSFSASGSNDSVLDLLASDGVTIIESDNDDGSFGGLSSSIAGARLPASGTYYLRVRHSNATSQLRPYQLQVRVQSGAPTAEIEPNDSVGTAQALPPSGWITGTIAITTDLDFYALSLNAGDSVYISLDLDPERDGLEWNGQAGLGVFNNFVLVVNDAGSGTPDSEAFFQTVRTAGTYYVFINGTAAGTYQLSVSVRPAETPAGTCTTYTSTDVSKVIPDLGIVTSTLTIPGNPTVADVDVSVVLTHTNMPDLDVHLVSPAGNDNGLFTDIGSNTQPVMNLMLDDEAATPIGMFTVVTGTVVQPEPSYRLSWLDGENAGGVWSLVLRDDATPNDGTLLGWSVRVCEPTPPPTCPIGSTPVTVFATDFEADDGGFTHGGVNDEWERGLPVFSPVTGCNSGSSCWKTDLDSTYNVTSSQDLTRTINLGNATGPVRLTWAQKYQMESANFDHAFVSVQPTNGSNPARQLWEFLDATMTNAVGNPSTAINESAGWGWVSHDISEFANQTIELKFHLDSDTTGNYAGLAIDDVSITACSITYYTYLPVILR